jgi:hypothetical protein
MSCGTLVLTHMNSKLAKMFQIQTGKCSFMHKKQNTPNLGSSPKAKHQHGAKQRSDTKQSKALTQNKVEYQHKTKQSIDTKQSKAFDTKQSIDMKQSKELTQNKAKH